jgi:hypothetical protein
VENHRNVVVGVTAIAIVAMFWGFFALAIIVAAATNPPESTLVVQGELQRVGIDDYFSPGRLVVGVIAGVVGSLALWAWVDLKLYSTSRFDRLPEPEGADPSSTDATRPTA